MENKIKVHILSMPRVRILTSLKDNPMTISEIVKTSKLKRSTIYHHLKHLKKRKLIIEKKDKKKQGQPVLISINEANHLIKKIIDISEKILEVEKRK